MNIIRIYATMILCLLAAAAHGNQQLGETVSITGQYNDDLYAAGGEVDSFASIAGDLVIAGGRLNIDSEVMDDVLAAGGEIMLRGMLYDDVRIAGGDIQVQAMIRDDLIAAGGKIHVAAKSRVGGKSWLSAGEIIIDGRLDGPLHASAGKVVISGRIGSDVLIWAGEVEILPGARIEGDLRYRSPVAATIHQGAMVLGEVEHTQLDVPAEPMIAGVIFMVAAVYLSMTVTAIVLYLLFTNIAVSSAQMTRQAYWSRTGLGFALLFVAPLIIVALMSTGIGSLLGLLVLLFYVFMLLTGYMAGVYFISEWVGRLFNGKAGNRFLGAIWLAVTMLLLALIGIVPVLGFIVGLLVLTSGTGSLIKLMQRGNRQQAPAESTTAQQ